MARLPRSTLAPARGYRERPQRKGFKNKLVEAPTVTLDHSVEVDSKRPARSTAEVTEVSGDMATSADESQQKPGEEATLGKVVGEDLSNGENPAIQVPSQALPEATAEESRRGGGKRKREENIADETAHPSSKMDKKSTRTLVVQMVSDTEATREIKVENHLQSNKVPQRTDKKMRLAADKPSWLDKLPQPADPSGFNRPQIDSNDLLAVVVAMIKSFAAWKPSPEVAANNYEYLENLMGIRVRNRYGAGEHIRSAYTAWCHRLLLWMKQGSVGTIEDRVRTTKDIGTKSPRALIRWSKVAEVLLKEHKPVWIEIAKQRRLGPKGNEQLRQATNGLFAKIIRSSESSL